MASRKSKSVQKRYQGGPVHNRDDISYLLTDRDCDSLDDPLLVARQEHRTPSPRMVCTFQAIPLDRMAFIEQEISMDLSQYGVVLKENKTKLAIRVRASDGSDYLFNLIKNIWVSKYLALGDNCILTWGPPWPSDGLCTVVFQKLEPKSPVSPTSSTRETQTSNELEDKKVAEGQQADADLVTRRDENSESVEKSSKDEASLRYHHDDTPKTSPICLDTSTENRVPFGGVGNQHRAFSLPSILPDTHKQA
ncbi:hypothetical protein F5Y16DRAFT_419534 [Xylariaceae sp. FL0255]|nr:hypothetical protein F5Y16DRAFT_419534 [Xylariaceae sp. FL0255]